MNAYWVPAALSLVLVVYHVAAGGRDIARPLLSSAAFPPDVVHVLYLCWHVVTIVLALSFIAYAAAAYDPAYGPFALAATVLNGTIAVWSLAVVVWRKQSHREMPQWVAFLALALSGVVANG